MDDTGKLNDIILSARQLLNNSQTDNVKNNTNATSHIHVSVVSIEHPKRVGFVTFAFGQYKNLRGSLFLDPLVGGMFLASLIDTEEICDDKTFATVYFVIGIIHFACGIVENLAEYVEQASILDGIVSPLEKILMSLSWWALQLMRIAEIPLVILLGYFSIKFSLLERDGWTHDQEEKKTNDHMRFCDRNHVHLAEITFSFQLFLSIMLVGLWYFMWYVDREDDDKERLEEQQWIKEEEKEAKTLYGKVKGTILLIGMHSFYDSNIGSLLLILSVTFPRDICSIDVLHWFLFAGVVHTLTGVISQLQHRVEEMALLDGIVNRAEHTVITLFKVCKFPLFIFELVCFTSILSLVISKYNTITYKKEEESDNIYCEEGLWDLMLAMTIIYSFVFILRVMVIIASLCTMGGMQKVEDLE